MAIKRAIKRVVVGDQILLSEAFKQFMLEKEALNKSPATIKSYHGSLKKFFDWAGDEVIGADINLPVVLEYAKYLKDDGCKPASINHYLRDIRAFFYWCMESSREYITPPFKIQLVKGQEEAPKFYTDEEQAALLEKPDKKADYSEWRTYAMVAFVLGTGARTATIIDMRVGDIDFALGQITYRHTKNKKAQIIPLSTELSVILKEFIKMWRHDAEDDDYLFANIGNKQLTESALRIAYRKYSTDRGLTKTSIHGLRHTFARSWILNGGNMVGLQKLLGHSTLDMTKKYVAIFGQDLKPNFDQFNPLDNFRREHSTTSGLKKIIRRK